MVRLHLLGFTPDLKGIVFSGRRGGRAGTYWVAVDETLGRALEQLEEAREEAQARGARGSRATRKPANADAVFKPPPERAAGDGRAGRGRRARAGARAEPETARAVPRAESKLSPAEIQQMLREGRTVKDVASRAGVEPAWIERFVGPVLHEMSGIIARTKEAYQERPRLGLSGLPIGEAVARNLRERRATAETLDLLDEGWEARKVGPRAWRVRLRFKHRGRRRIAEWDFRTDNRSVRPRGKEAIDLGWRPGGRERRSVGPGAPGPGAAGGEPSARASGPSEPARKRRKRTTTKAAGKRRAPLRRASGSGRATARRRAGTTRSAAKKKSPTRRTTVRRATAGRKPARRATAARKPARRASTRGGASRTAAPRRKP